MRVLLPVLLLALLGFAAQAADSPPPLLRFDPFQKLPGSEAASGDDGGTAAWEPQLKAVLVSGQGSMANLGGVVLKIGQETSGYTLVEVHEFAAVFERGGQRLTLSIERDDP